MFFKSIEVGSLQANCYVLAAVNEAVCIDPGDDFPKIIDQLKSNNLTLVAIINTHGHYDHIGANANLAKEYSCPVYIHQDEMCILKDSAESIAFFSGGSMEIEYQTIPVDDEEILNLGGLEFKIIHTPGHSPGGICLLQNGNLFTGDTLFKQSIGRTDFPGSDPVAMQKSLAILTKLDKSLKVFPGHGQSTILEDELSNNPYLQ